MTGRFAQNDHHASVAGQIREVLHEAGEDLVLIGEYTNDDTADLTGDGWQGAMNYVGFTRPVWSWVMGSDYAELMQHSQYRVAPGTGRSAADGMVEFLAGVPWSVAVRHWNLVSSHDSARIRTVTGSAELTAVAALLLLTYVGTPMIFAGDEWGLEGVDGEDARPPMPWDRLQEQDSDTFETYRRLIALRGSVAALRHGGLRWVICEDDAIGYLRETADERILVVAVRKNWSGAVLPAFLAPTGAVETLYGATDLVMAAEGLLIPGDGPAGHVWRLG